MSTCVGPPQGLLKKTAEKKEERKKERLNDYYKRNFKECECKSITAALREVAVPVGRPAHNPPLSHRLRF